MDAFLSIVDTIRFIAMAKFTGYGVFSQCVVGKLNFGLHGECSTFQICYVALACYLLGGNQMLIRCVYSFTA